MTKLATKYSRLTFCDEATRVRLVRPLLRRPAQPFVPTHRRSDEELAGRLLSGSMLVGRTRERPCLLMMPLGASGDALSYSVRQAEKQSLQQQGGRESVTRSESVRAKLCS